MSTDGDLGTDGDGDPKVFVLKRELSEVHLLLDNISSNPDTKLPVTQVDVPDGLDKDWLKKICQMDWPPAANDDKADEACLLIRAKDFLNTQAKPASGATIAFTILVTQDDHRVSRNTPSRTSLARSAYPDLIAKAIRFRRWIGGLAIFLALWLLATCLLSWAVTYGNLAVGHLSSAQAAYDLAAGQVEGTEVVPADADSSQAHAPDASAPASAPAKIAAKPTPLLTAEFLCEKAAKEMAAGNAKSFVSLTQMQACESLTATANTVTDARNELSHWLITTHDNEDYLEIASDRSSVLGNGILPFFFGVLGAGAAIVRSLMGKIKMNILSPRDLNLSLQQLALGAVTGACIGLFVAQPGTNGSSGPGMLNTVALSGSTLSFIAGFGVDAVFATIEGIIQRIFNLPPPPGSDTTLIVRQGHQTAASPNSTAAAAPIAAAAPPAVAAAAAPAANPAVADADDTDKE